MKRLWKLLHTKLSSLLLCALLLAVLLAGSPYTNGGEAVFLWVMGCCGNIILLLARAPWPTTASPNG